MKRELLGANEQLVFLGASAHHCASVDCAVSPHRAPRVALAELYKLAEISSKIV